MIASSSGVRPKSELRHVSSGRGLLCLVLVGMLAVLESCVASSRVVSATNVSAPYLERLEVVAADGTGGDGGNGWGSNKLRIVRTSNDDVYTTYLTQGTDYTHKNWILMHRPPSGGWSRVGSGVVGREPANLLVSPSDRLSVVTWPEGVPTLVNDAGPNGQGPYTPTTIPINWPAENWPYAAAATLRGDQYVLRLYAPYETNTKQLYAVRKAGSSTWATGSFDLPVQYAYAILLPDPTGGVHLIMSRDTTWSALGYAQPPSGPSGPYAQDRVSYWYSPDLATTPFSSELVVHTEAQPAAAYVNAFGQEAYLDTRGRVHIFYAVLSTATGPFYVGHHVILQGGNIVKDVVLQGVDCADSTRILQDSREQFYLFTACDNRLTVWPAGSVDGTDLGSPTILDLSPYFSSTWFWLAAPRGGTQLADYVDGVYPTGQDAKLVYFRVRLNSGGTSSGSASYKSQVLADNPLGYWRLDETSGNQAADATGRGNSGTYSASGVTLGLTGAIPGDPDRSAGFDGRRGGVFVNNVGPFPGKRAFSVEAWANPTGSGTWSRLVADEDGSTGYPGWALYLNASSGAFEGLRADESGTDYITGNPLPLNSWSHVVLTYDGVSLRLYQNASLSAGPVSSTRSLPTTSAPLAAARSWGTINPFAGRLDEVALYSIALSSDQIARHYSLAGR